MSATATARSSARRPTPPRRSRAAATGAKKGALDSRRGAFERYFAGVLPGASRVPQELHEAMRYSALSPGKRLRPMLALAACEAVGASWTRALPAAVAVECVHAFSLVHDDLPAMDDDDYRRGRLTTHKKFGEALGVLAGDALLALAFSELSRLESRGVPPKQVVEATRVLARAAGSEELVGGQALDLSAQGRATSARAVREIHLRKTGALIAAALDLGGIAGGASAAQRRTLARAGRELGLAFQIHDDLLNRLSSLGRLGKRSGTDEARGKATYPRAVGEARARLEAARLFQAALGRVLGLGPKARNLGHVVLAVAERDR